MPTAERAAVMSSAEKADARGSINNFDLIRLLAALQVTYTHGTSWLQLPPLYAPIHQAILAFPGVAVFFGVSGFLISRSYLKPNTSLLQFVENRALRIYPGLWVNILTLVVMIAVAGNFQPGFLFSANSFIWLAQMMISGSNTAAGWIPPSIAYWNDGGAFTYFPSGVLWTLSIELLFYALVPLIFAKVLVRRNLHFVTVAIALALSLSAFWNKDLAQGPGYIDDYLWVFLVGAVINLIWPIARWAFEGKAAFWLGLYLALVFWRGSSSYQDASPYSLGMTLLLIIATISTAYTWRRLSSALIRDDLSYGIYLWHMPIIWTMVIHGWVGGWQYYGIALAAAFLIALIVRVSVEKPALALKGRLSRHFGRPATEQAQS